MIKTSPWDGDPASARDAAWGAGVAVDSVPAKEPVLVVADVDVVAVDSVAASPRP